MIKFLFFIFLMFHLNCFSENSNLDKIKNYINNLNIQIDTDLYLEIDFELKFMNILSNINLKGLGNSTIYEISIPEFDKVHTVGFAKIIVIISNSNIYHEICTNFYLFNIREDDGYLIGISNYFRGNSFFGIINFGKDTNEVIFSTSPYHFVRSSIDCFDYKNYLLDFNNIDLNDDGFLDLEFTGIKYIYCKGLEIGPSREDTKPLDSLKVELKVMYDQKKENWNSEYKESKIK